MRPVRGILEVDRSPAHRTQPNDTRIEFHSHRIVLLCSRKLYNRVRRAFPRLSAQFVRLAFDLIDEAETTGL